MRENRLDPVEIARHYASIHHAIGADLAHFGGILRCITCGNQKPLGHIARHLRDGWPRCCGETMRWITERQLAGEHPHG